MLLKKIFKNPKESLIYMERFVNNGSPSGYTWINQTSKETSILSKNQFFYLYNCYVNDVEIIGTFPELKVKDFYNTILIHPDMKNNVLFNKYKICKSDIRVAPTASSRTVKLLDYPGYLKLNYNGIIGRIDRSLTSNHAYASYELTKLLMNILLGDKFQNLCFFPEVSAKINKGDFDFATVFRDEVPVGIHANKIKYIIPAFSLFSKDRIKNDDSLLLTQIIREKQEKPLDFLLESIIFPIIKNYFTLLLTEGLQPEWHSQNILVGLDNNLNVQLIMRDLDSIDIDQSLRNKKGKTELMKFYPYKYIHDNQFNYRIKHSFMYDFKIGEYLFEPLIKVILNYTDYDMYEIYEIIKQYSNKFIRYLPKDFFPDNNKWYMFDKVLIDRSLNTRPYIEYTHPKFR